MDTEDRKLTSEEIDEMLKEVEESHQPIRKKNENRKKKKRIRPDMIIAAVVVIALIVGAVLLVKHFAGQTGSDSTGSSEDNPLLDEQYPEISDVVKNYLNAYLIEDSEERLSILAQYVDNMGDISEGDISQNQYVEAYTDIECYSKEGPYENTYVIYAYYQMKLKNISATVPSITRLYVIRDSSTGNVYIHNGVSDEVEEYIEEVTQDEDVQELFADVNQEYEEALESDEQLKEFFEKLEPDTTAAEESDEDAQESDGESTEAKSQTNSSEETQAAEGEE